MTIYFRSKIITHIHNCYDEAYYFGLSGDNWNKDDANNFVQSWINAQKKDLLNLNKNIERTFEPAEECTASQYKNCFLKVNFT